MTDRNDNAPLAARLRQIANGPYLFAREKAEGDFCDRTALFRAADALEAAPKATGRAEEIAKALEAFWTAGRPELEQAHRNAAALIREQHEKITELKRANDTLAKTITESYSQCPAQDDERERLAEWCEDRARSEKDQAGYSNGFGFSNAASVHNENAQQYDAIAAILRAPIEPDPVDPYKVDLNSWLHYDQDGESGEKSDWIMQAQDSLGLKDVDDAWYILKRLWEIAESPDLNAEPDPVAEVVRRAATVGSITLQPAPCDTGCLVAITTASGGYHDYTAGTYAGAARAALEDQGWQPQTEREEEAGR